MPVFHQTDEMLYDIEIMSNVQLLKQYQHIQIKFLKYISCCN